MEVLAACGREVNTVGICNWSSTNRLTELLHGMKDQRFTIAQLHSKLVNYRAAKGSKKLLRTPYHGIMSNKDKATIRISSIARKSGVNSPKDMDKTSLQEFEHSNKVSFRVLIAVSVQGDLDKTAWRDWLPSHLPGGIKGLSLVRPEGI